jgi:hypothetical protein
MSHGFRIDFILMSHWFIVEGFVDEGFVKGFVDEGFPEGFVEGFVDEGLVEGFVEGFADEGFVEGFVQRFVDEGFVERFVEGIVDEGFVEGFVDEGLVEGFVEGFAYEGFVDGVVEARTPDRPPNTGRTPQHHSCFKPYPWGTTSSRGHTQLRSHARTQRNRNHAESDFPVGVSRFHTPNLRSDLVYLALLFYLAI